MNNTLLLTLQKHAPLYINIHIISNNDITKEFRKLCKRLINFGIVLGSQTVLLKGINDNYECLKKMFMDLLAIGIRPYYLYDLDDIGCNKFRVDIERGKELMQKLRNNVSGLAIPKYVKDTKEGKIILGA